MPAALEERVAYLEGKVEEHSYAWRDLKEAIRETSERITHMEQKFDQPFAQINQRIDRLFFFILATLASSLGALISAITSIFAR